MGYSELIDLQLKLRVTSECGEVIYYEAQLFRHNSATDEEVMRIFHEQCKQAEEQLCLFLANRGKRIQEYYA